MTYDEYRQVVGWCLMCDPLVAPPAIYDAMKAECDEKGWGLPRMVRQEMIPTE